MTRRGKGRPSAAAAAAIDVAVRDAALAALVRDGPDVTMNAIVAATGLARKTVYARYPTREALLAVAIRDLLDGSDPVTFDRGGTIEDQLRRYAREALRLVRTPEALALQRVIVFDPGYARTLASDIDAATDQIFAAPLRACLADAHSAGDLRDVPTDQVAAAVVALLLAEGSRAGRDGPAGGDRAAQDAADAAYADFLADLVCRGLVRR